MFLKYSSEYWKFCVEISSEISKEKDEIYSLDDIKEDIMNDTFKIIKYNGSNIGSISFNEDENNFNVFFLYILKKYRKTKGILELNKHIFSLNKNIIFFINKKNIIMKNFIKNKKAKKDDDIFDFRYDKYIIKNNRSL